MSGKRPLEHRIAIRWPAVAHLSTRSVLRLPIGSRPRRAALERTAQKGYEAWNQGDLDIARAFADPDIEVRVQQIPDNTVGFDDAYYGPDGYCKVMEEWNDAWKSWRADLDDVVEVARDKILITGLHTGEGYSSGIELEEYGAVLYTFRRGKIFRVDGFFGTDKSAVLEAMNEVIGGATAEAPPADRAAAATR